MGLIGAMARTSRGDRADREQTERIRQKRLEALVRYARANSPYYRALYAGVGDSVQLDELPPTSKPEMMARFDDFLTDRNVTMARIDAFTADPDNIGRMLYGKYLVFQTSGSTGNPAVVLYDKEMIDVASAVAAFRTFARKEDYRAFMKHGKKTAGVFADYGFYTSDVSLSNLEKKTISIADKSAIITESGKFGRRSLTRFASLEDIDLLITDPGLSPEDEAKLKSHGIEVVKTGG